MTSPTPTPDAPPPGPSPVRPATDPPPWSRSRTVWVVVAAVVVTVVAALVLPGLGSDGPDHPPAAEVDAAITAVEPQLEDDPRVEGATLIWDSSTPSDLTANLMLDVTAQPQLSTADLEVLVDDLTEQVWRSELPAVRRLSVSVTTEDGERRRTSDVHGTSALDHRELEGLYGPRG